VGGQRVLSEQAVRGFLFEPVIAKSGCDEFPQIDEHYRLRLLPGLGVSQLDCLKVRRRVAGAHRWQFAGTVTCAWCAEALRVGSWPKRNLTPCRRVRAALLSRPSPTATRSMQPEISAAKANPELESLLLACRK